MHHFVVFPSVPVLYIQGTEIVKFQVHENYFITTDFYEGRGCGISTSANGFCDVTLRQSTRLSLCGSLSLNSTILLVLVKCL